MQAEARIITAYQTMIGHGPHVLCPVCGSQIHFIKTAPGKNSEGGKLMPCQLELEYGDERKTLVTNSGRTVRKAGRDVIGYQPHWGFCKR
jgi:hypothetical protein